MDHDAAPYPPESGHNESGGIPVVGDGDDAEDRQDEGVLGEPLGVVWLKGHGEVARCGEKKAGYADDARESWKVQHPAIA